jgi:hypothetical protein
VSLDPQVDKLREIGRRGTRLAILFFFFNFACMVFELELLSNTEFTNHFSTCFLFLVVTQCFCESKLILHSVFLFVFKTLF